MATETEAAEWILDRDGSFRAITFTPTTKDHVVAFIKSLLSDYTLRSAYDDNGIDRSSQLHSGDPLDGIDGYLHVVLVDGSGMISQLQLFIDYDPTSDKLGVELTFSPDDIDQQQFTIKSFCSRVDAWNDILKSDDYFVRYENAGWRLHDPNEYGVIYSRKQPPGS